MATIVASLVIGLMILSPTTVIPNVSAQSSNHNIDYLLRQVKPMSSTEITKATKLAESDPAVQKIINGRSYTVMSTDLVGNLYTTPIISYPDIHFNVANETQVEVVVNLQNNSILSVNEWSLIKTYTATDNKSKKHPDGHTFGIDYIVSSQTVNGLQMNYKAVSYGSSGADQFSAFLINAAEHNAGSYRCTSTHVADSYFAQAGALFSKSSASMGYANTGTSCIFQSVSWVPYNTNDNYVFEVYVSSSPSNWNMAVTDSSNGNYFVQGTTGQNYYYFDIVDTDTSGFFENANDINAPTWYNQFGSTNLSATAAYSTNGGSSWNNWTNDGQVVYDCNHNNSTASVFSGNFQNGGTTTWNIKNMPLAC